VHLLIKIVEMNMAVPCTVMPLTQLDDILCSTQRSLSSVMSRVLPRHDGFW